MHAKKVNGATYYCLREMARVDGKPRRVSERHLGTAEEIASAMTAREGVAFADWWATTAADRFTRVPAAAPDHRRFWDTTWNATLAALTEIERRITLRRLLRAPAPLDRPQHPHPRLHPRTRPDRRPLDATPGCRRG
jgi:hypothetical protein